MRHHRHQSPQPHYDVVATTPAAVWLVDLDDGGPSVTNAAEQVCRQVVERYGNVDIFYRDTMGRWDQLIHKAGAFVIFGPGERPPT